MCIKRFAIQAIYSQQYTARHKQRRIYPDRIEYNKRERERERRLGGRAAGCREKSHRAKPKEHPKKLGQRDRNFLHHFYNKTKIYEPLFAYTKAVLLFREKERER